MKIQTTFEGVTVPDIVKSLRSRRKHEYTERELTVSTEEGPSKLRAEERKNAVRYDK